MSHDGGAAAPAATRARAWQFDALGGPERLRLVEQELRAPAAGEALVRMRAIGLNRSDLLWLAGRYFGPPPSPACVGQEGVGQVLALGPPGLPSPAPGFAPRVGDRVALLVGRVDLGSMGSFRTAGLYPVSALLPVPEAFSDAEGAGLWVGALTAVGGLMSAGLGPGAATGRSVLVTAASSAMGVAALQAARAWGATTLAATTSPSKAERLATLADHVVVARDAETLAAATRERSGGRGADVVFDPVGFAYVPAFWKATAPDAHVVLYGILAGSEAALDLRALIQKDLTLHGYTIYRLLRDPAQLMRVIAAALTLAHDGRLRPLVASEYAFEQAPEALTALGRGEHLGKLVLHVG